jgi:hypothetical protein
MFRGLGSRVGIQGVGDEGDGAGLLDGVDGVFEDRENGEGKRSWGREYLWNFSYAGVGRATGRDVLLSSIFLGFGCWDLRGW